MNNLPPKPDSIFWTAQAIESSEARAAYLDAACRGDAALRRQMDELLAAYPQLAEFLEEPAASTEGFDNPLPIEQPGMQIGPYRLLQELGEGGMGLVFLAEQTQPVERQVALKIIKAGMDSRQVLARFKAEEQTLALMDHPNIAKVFDAGTTESGRPYFVMELVNGIPITQYCDQEHLTPRERLELVIPVCRAVQHAHQKGIIHRDLKPSNVIVALYDGQPVPKVIDFGVSKATGTNVSDRSEFTAVGQMVGTLEYMAPEQAELNNLDVDTRADIYSLGVLLYELLTGSPPFSCEDLHRAAFDEILRVIREVEPPKPSTRLSHSAELPAIAANRKLEPQRLTKIVSGELDWIVMKCLEKERNRRYDTATGLVADIERYLHDEPVQAGPPSRLYRIRKYWRRNKATLTALAAVACALLVGLCGTTWQAVRASRAESLAETRFEAERAARSLAEAERNRANAQSQRADAEAQRAKEQEEKARTEAALAQAVKDFLQTKLLGQADMRNQAEDLLRLGRSASEATPNPTIRELLERAVIELAPDKINENFPQQFMVQSEILRNVGDIYRQFGAYKQAIDLLQRAADLRKEHRGENDPTTLRALDDLAVAFGDAGRLAEAIALHQQVGKVRTAILGPKHEDTLITLGHLANDYYASGRLEDALELNKQILAAKEETHRGDDRDTLATLHNLAVLYGTMGNFAKAIPLLERVRAACETKYGLEHPDTLMATYTLAVGYGNAGDPARTAEILSQIRPTAEARFGPDNPDTLKVLDGLAVAYTMTGRVSEAIEILEHVRAVAEVKFGPAHPDTLRTLQNLASAYDDVGRLPEAILLYKQAFEAQQATLGSDNPDTLLTGQNLAVAYGRAGQLDAAIVLLESLCKGCEHTYGSDNPRTLKALDTLASAYRDADRLPESIELRSQVREAYEKQFGRQDPRTMEVIAKLGMTYRCAGRLEEALPLLKEAFEARARQPWAQHVAFELLTAYVQSHSSAEATSLVETLLAPVRESLAADQPQLAARLALFSSRLLEMGAFSDAETVLRECLTIRESVQPDVWTTFNTRSLLGGALLGQAREMQASDMSAAAAKIAQAEELLLKGYDGMQQRADMTTPGYRVQLIATLERLVELYKMRNKPDEAARWQQRLDEVNAHESSSERH